ncbi:MAG TPA: MFS transporter [Planctomycetota bacterium]|nr:MFS transporter [Planctomycetota bacterium]
MKSWRKTFTAACIAQTCSILGFSLAMPFMAFYIRELGVTDNAAVARWSGIVNGAAGLTMAIFAPIWGLLADRYGRRPMVMRSMYGGVLVLLLISIARDVHQLVAFRLLQGALTGTIAALVALVASEAPREKAGYALGIMQAAVFVGFSVGPLIGGVLADAVGYRVTFALSSLLLLAGGLLVQFGTREGFVPRARGEGGGRDGFRSVFAGPGFLAAVFALFTLRFANSAAAPTFGLFIEEIYGTGVRLNSVVGLVTAAGGFAAAIGAVLLGHLGDRWGHKRVLIAACLYGGLVSLAYTYANTVVELGGIRVLFGLGAAGILPAANAIIRHTTEDHNVGRAYGVTASAGSIGWMLGPWSGGYAAGVYGLRAPFLVMAAGLWVSAAVVAGLVRRDPPRGSLGAGAPLAGP